FAGKDGTAKYNASLNGGAAFGDAPSFWSSSEKLLQYDVVLLSCEGTPDAGNKSADALAAMKSYLDAGGRVFASHWHNYWLKKGPAPFPSLATFVSEPDLNSITASLDSSFPKGQAFAEWLINVNASTTKGELPIEAAQHTVRSVNASLAQRWIYKEPTG